MLSPSQPQERKPIITASNETGPYEYVLIIGPGITTRIDTIEQECNKNEMSYCIIGDGQNSLDIEDLNYLKGKVSKTAFVDVTVHGEKYEDKHYSTFLKNDEPILSSTVLKKLKDVLPYEDDGAIFPELGVTYYSCYAGAIKEEEIPEGMLVGTYSGKDDGALIVGAGSSIAFKMDLKHGSEIAPPLDYLDSFVWSSLADCEEKRIYYKHTGLQQTRLEYTIPNQRRCMSGEEFANAACAVVEGIRKSLEDVLTDTKSTPQQGITTQLIRRVYAKYILHTTKVALDKDDGYKLLEQVMATGFGGSLEEVEVLAALRKADEAKRATLLNLFVKYKLADQASIVLREMCYAESTTMLLTNLHTTQINFQPSLGDRLIATTALLFSNIINPNDLISAYSSRSSSNADLRFCLQALDRYNAYQIKQREYCPEIEVALMDINTLIQGKTALHIAIEQHNYGAISMLLANQYVDPNTKNAKGQTAIQLAMSLSDIRAGILLTNDPLNRVPRPAGSHKPLSIVLLLGMGLLTLLSDMIEPSPSTRER